MDIDIQQYLELERTHPSGEGFQRFYVFKPGQYCLIVNNVPGKDEYQLWACKNWNAAKKSTSTLDRTDNCPFPLNTAVRGDLLDRSIRKFAEWALSQPVPKKKELPPALRTEPNEIAPVGEKAKETKKPDPTESVDDRADKAMSKVGRGRPKKSK